MAATVRASNRGTVKAKAFYSVHVVIPDDDVYSFLPDGTFGHVLIGGANNSWQGMLSFASGSGVTSLAGTITASTSALTGTTGTDGNVTFSINGGNCYLENRSGASRTFILTVFTFNDVTD